MKSVYRFVGLLTLILASTGAFAQDDIDQLLTESIDDGRKLVDAYISPVMKGLSLGLNQGWYNTAAPHKIAGFDLTVTVSALTIPKSEMFFNVSDLGLDVVRLDDSSPDYPFAPTAVGPDRAPTFAYDDDETGQTTTFDGPGGLGIEEEIGYNVVPMPMAQLGIGLPKGTDVKLRYTPTIDLDGDGNLKLFGIGVMHNVKQWIPGIKQLPFDLSGFVGYTKFKMEAFMDPEDHPDQVGLFEMNATTIQGLISKKFSVLTLYGGVGYNIAKSRLAMKGEYDVDDDGDIEDHEVNPLDLKYSASGLRATAGFRLKLAILTLHADYTLQKYKALTVGIGFSVR